MATFTKNNITLFNNIKTIFKLLEPLILIQSTLLHFFAEKNTTTVITIQALAAGT